MIVEHDLGVGVGVDGVRAAVGIGDDRLGVPTVEAGRVPAGGVAELVGSLAWVGAGAAASLRIASARRRLQRDALRAVVLEVIVSIGGDIAIGQVGYVGAWECSRQASVGSGIEDVFQAVGVTVGLPRGVVAVIAVGQHVVGAVLDGGGHEVAETAAV